MKSSILYATTSGHSKKIAMAVSKKLNIEALDLKSNPKISNCDLLFIVSGIYGGQCKPELLEFVNNLSNEDVKATVLITSSMREVPQHAIRDALVSKGIVVKKDEYICKGGFLFFSFTHPNKAEINEAINFCKKHYC